MLWALHHDLGWDPADIIVGTSAGSIVGALLRSNVAPEDLAAWATRTDPSTNGHEFRAVMDFTDSIVTRLAVPRLTALGWHMLNLVRHPSQLPGAMATMLPNAASCAIPVLARPVRIGNHRYVDGGVKSATHADVLVDANLDLVIVLPPMGHRGGRHPLRVLPDRQSGEGSPHWSEQVWWCNSSVPTKTRSARWGST